MFAFRCDWPVGPLRLGWTVTLPLLSGWSSCAMARHRPLFFCAAGKPVRRRLWKYPQTSDKPSWASAIAALPLRSIASYIDDGVASEGVFLRTDRARAFSRKGCLFCRVSLRSSSYRSGGFSGCWSLGSYVLGNIATLGNHSVCTAAVATTARADTSRVKARGAREGVSCRSPAPCGEAVPVLVSTVTLLE